MSTEDGFAPEPGDAAASDLLAEQYADASRLASRRRIYFHDSEPIDFVAWTLGQVEWRGGEVVVDVGCGDGLYLQAALDGGAALVVGIDRSVGMLGAATPAAARVAGDAGRLPLARAFADLVLAMHMLYHVPDAMGALREMRRVLRPGGTLMAATNGEDHMTELRALLVAVLAEVPGAPPVRPPFSSRWDLGRGARDLASVFGQVERRDLQRRLAVTEPSAVVDYVMSHVPEGDFVPAVRAEVHRRVSRAVERHGAFTVSSHSGVLLAR